jgi:hypothetical protein
MLSCRLLLSSCAHYALLNSRENTLCKAYHFDSCRVMESLLLNQSLEWWSDLVRGYLIVATAVATGIHPAGELTPLITITNPRCNFPVNVGTIGINFATSICTSQLMLSGDIYTHLVSAATLLNSILRTRIIYWVGSVRDEMYRRYFRAQFQIIYYTISVVSA